MIVIDQKSLIQTELLLLLPFRLINQLINDQEDGEVGFEDLMTRIVVSDNAQPSNPTNVVN